MTILFDAVLKDAQSMGSEYRDICWCRDDLLGFLDRNEWFGQDPKGSGRKITVEDYEVMRPSVCLWLSAYQKSNAERFDILIEAYQDRMPDTCRAFEQFADREGIRDEPGGWEILDFILSSCDRELSEYDNDETDRLVKETASALSLKAATLFAKFITETYPDRACRYEIHSRRLTKDRNDAYTIHDFSVMAYCVFNERSWKENGLIEKALDSVNYADLWLFTAFHFLGGLRQTDIVRLPVPALPYPAETTKEMIRSGCYRREDAAGVAEELLLRMRYQPIYPSKTGRFRGVPDLKLFIPESLKEPVGLIISIKLIHHKKGEPLVKPVQDLLSIRRFFGGPFADSIGKHSFRTRRANKSYLQGIEMVTEDDPGRPKGYMLAALARSHKGGIGTLPEITDVYLRDAAFSGYRPEFILREMFERGIFGFIPALLLERYAGEGYRRLGVSEQTELIRCIGLDAVQLEDLSMLVERALNESREIVAALPEGSLPTILQRIASGAASSKQEETLCLCIAAGIPCPMPLRGGCIGCGYEIYTKAAFHLLMKEYERMRELKDSSLGAERERLRNILMEGILPAIGQMIVSLPMLYPGADMGAMTAMMERGLKDADNN